MSTLPNKYKQVAAGLWPFAGQPTLRSGRPCCSRYVSPLAQAWLFNRNMDF
ncbi:hypothetical protein Misp06_04397 [Microbulbifer sp. NBRC 101763]